MTLDPLFRLLGFVCFLALPASLALAQPAVTLSPPSGPPTKVVAVSGTGFGASAGVDIYFDTVHVCLAVSNSAGAISCNVTVPANAQPGQHWITALKRANSAGAQASFAVRTNWLQFHGNTSRRTGFNRFENTINTGNVSRLELLWKASLGNPRSPTRGTPIVANGRVLIGSEDGKLHSFDAQTGVKTTGWPKQAGLFSEQNGNSPAFGGGNVYIGSGEGKLYAFKLNGASVPGFPVTLSSDRLETSPIYVGGKVVIGGYDGNLYAVNVSTASVAWSFPTGGLILSSPAVANGVVYVGTTINLLHAISLADGTSLAGFPRAAGGDIVSSPAIAQGRVLVGSSSGLFAYDAATGNPTAGYPVLSGDNADSSPAIASGIAYFGSTDGKLYAARLRDGAAPSSQFPLQLDGAVEGSPVIANGIIYANTNASLYAITLTGSILAQIPLTTNWPASPVVVDGVVYVGSKDGYLYAFAVDGADPARAQQQRGAPFVGASRAEPPSFASLTPDLSLTPAHAPE